MNFMVCLWKEEILREFKSILLEANDIGIKTLNCFECMKVPLDFIEDILFVKMMSLQTPPESILKNSTSLEKACVLVSGYVLGIYKIISIFEKSCFFCINQSVGFNERVAVLETFAGRLLVAKDFWARYEFAFEVCNFLLKFVFSTFFLLFLVKNFIPYGFLGCFLPFRMFAVNKIFKSNSTCINFLKIEVSHELQYTSLYFYADDNENLDKEAFFDFMSIYFNGKAICMSDHKIFNMKLKKDKIEDNMIEDLKYFIESSFCLFSAQKA